MRKLWHKYIVLFNDIRLEVGGMEGIFLPEERRRAKCEDTEGLATHLMPNHPSDSRVSSSRPLWCCHNPSLCEIRCKKKGCGI